jgi:thioredoxin reductase
VGLIGLFERQLENAGIGVNIEEVLEVSLHRRTFFLQTDKRAVTSKILVVAAGTRPKRLKGMPFSEEVEQSLFYEVFPLLHLANKNIAIIGSGDAAFDYGLNLSRRNKVVIIGRRGKVKCIPLLWKRAEENQNISYLADAAINTITRADKGLLLTRGQKNKDIYADYVVVAIGREPGLDFLRPEVRRSIKRLMNTKVLYLVGDVKNRIYRQTAICVGDGVRAAMEICQRMRG